MKMTDSTKEYKAPLAKAITVKTQGILCLSKLEGMSTDQFTISKYIYGDNDFDDYH